MTAKKLHIVVSQPEGDYFIVNLVRGGRGITLRSYKSTEAISARSFANDLSELIDCDWIDKRR